jgi:GGDEF domain-containing protein
MLQAGMISIRKYMLERRNGSDRRDQAESADSVEESEISQGPSGNIFPVYQRLLGHIGAYLLLNGESMQLQSQLAELQRTVHPDATPDEARQFDETARAILACQGRLIREASQNAAIEMQQVVGVLGQALAALGEGTERSVSRLQRIQETLHRTTAIQDVSRLRASLAEAVDFIRHESVREFQAAAQERESFETEAVRIRERLSGNPNRQLPGRSEGIRAIHDFVSGPSASVAQGQATFIIVIVFDQLKAIVQRYGPEAVDDLFLLLIRERLQPVAPASSAYRWTTAAMVAVFQREPDLFSLNSAMGAVNREPLVYQIALGSRKATLKVGLSHLVLQTTGKSPDALIAEIDRFTGADPVGAS